MAKDRRKVQHIHSSVPDKQPTPASLEVGEIAVNNSKNQEFLSIKNSEDKVVRFSSDEQVITIMERKEVMPYEGLVRGAEGPGGSKDSYNSYGITEGDLKANKSNLIIKLNQVAAGNTTKHDKVNGAKDIYNNLVNPTTDGGLNDGAGFAIDMSRYAMIGANPTFSSMTTTCHTELNGRTEILGGNGTAGDCRSYLKIDMLTADTKVGSAKTDISTATTVIGTNNTTISGNTTLNVSGTTTENHLQDVNINNSQNYTILTSGNTVIHSNGAVGISAKEDITAVSTENNVYVTANKNLCASAGDNATLYGEDVTNIGTSCNGTGASTNTNINGVTITNSATTINNSATTINNTATTYNVTATTHFNGDVYIDNSKKLYLTPDCTSELSSTTVNAALCEVLDRSEVTFKVGDYAATDENLKWYELWQNNKQIKDQNGNPVRIDIPKDHILKDVSIVNGHASGDSFTACTAGDKTCEWYIKLVWNVFNPTTGYSNDKTVYLPANNLVQDHSFDDTSAINFTTDYDGQKIHVSADTTVQIVTPNGTSAFTKNNAVHSLNSYKLTTEAGSFSAKEFDPFKESVTINVPTDASHITRKTLKISHNGLSKTYDPGSSDEDWTLPHSALTLTYGATSGESGSVTFNTSASGSVNIPTCVNHLNRNKLTFSAGTFTASTYDPGQDCTNNDESIAIPASLSHLTDWSNNCLSVNNNLCVSGTVTSTGGMYTSSDKALKDDIHYIRGEEISRASKVELKSFYYKSDPSRRKVYGVIAQDVEHLGLEELVHYDENGIRSVDYTGLLLLKIAALEKEISILKNKFDEQK